MNRLPVKNARMINEGREFEGDLRIRRDRIGPINDDLEHVKRVDPATTPGLMIFMRLALAR